MSVIICKQCGEAKAATDENFRRYYAGRKGRYKTCKACESINNRYKYLLAKQEPTESEVNEMQRIAKLYDLLQQRGLNVPNIGEGRRVSVEPVLDELLTKNAQIVETMQRVGELPKHEEPQIDEVPEELQKWLTDELGDNTPEHLIDTVYEDLREKYLKTHKPVLEKILSRFYEYEDEWHARQ